MVNMLDDDDIAYVLVELAGRWYCPTVDPYEFIEFNVNVNWQFWLEGNAIDEGYLLYDEEMRPII